MYENWKMLKKSLLEHQDKPDVTISIMNEENPFRKEYSDVARWCNNSGNYYIVDDGEYYKVEKIPESTEEEKATQVRKTRDSYLKTYVDPIVTNPLRMADMSEVELNEIKAYRQYLLDIPESSEFPDLIVMTLDEWKADKAVDNR